MIRELLELSGRTSDEFVHLSDGHQTRDCGDERWRVTVIFKWLVCETMTHGPSNESILSDAPTIASDASAVSPISAQRLVLGWGLYK